MHAGNPQLRQGCLQLFRRPLGRLQAEHTLILALLNSRAHHINLVSVFRLPPDKPVQPLPVPAVHREGVHLLPPGGHLVQNRHIQIAVNNQCQRPGNRRCRHHQHVHRLTLGCQRCPLPHTEAVLLIRDHQPQPGVDHIIGEEGVGSHQQVNLPVRQGTLHGVLLPHGHGPRQLLHPHSQRREQACKRFAVLLRQNLRWRHKGGHRSVPVCCPGQGSRAQGFAAAHIALKEPVHGPAGRHVGQSLPYGPLLSPGGGEGQACVKRLHIRRAEAKPGLFHPAGSPPFQGACQQKQLLKHQPAPGLPQCLKISGEVHILIGIGCVCQLQPLHQLSRDGLGQLLHAGIQPASHALGNHLLRQPPAHGINRHNPACHAPGGIGLFIHRVGHGPALALALHPPVEDVFLAPADVVFHPALVEVCHLQHAGVIKHLELHKLHAAPDAGQPRLIRNHGRDAHIRPVLRPGNGHNLASVLIPSGEK